MIEVEARSFIPEEKYNELIDYFKDKAEYVGEDEQIMPVEQLQQLLDVIKGNNYTLEDVDAKQRY